MFLLLAITGETNVATIVGTILSYLRLYEKKKSGAKSIPSMGINDKRGRKKILRSGM